MPINCSAPGCRINSDKEERIPVFKMPQKPGELRHARLHALHREDIEAEVVYVCVKHFREDVEYTFRALNGYDYYLSHSATKHTRLSQEPKDDELLNQAVTLSLR
ncbi:hypothetical protein LOD99_7074 [Oopsacas minuta]|uniref:THAP-type domain-containing protein n=1 Tax=Oopsacas minuta TaxID=111878 RepID=A0AAV7JIP7_9METZ|nr:hypothetical protein LOD99_7074 [Oopsacas minuta]